MILGAVWSGAWAKIWAPLAHPGKTQEQIQAGPKWIYGIAALGGLITAIILAAVLAATRSIGMSRIGDALLVTILLWVGFVLVKYATTYAFEDRSWTLMAIDVGYPLASMLTQTAIIAAWP